MEDVEKELGNEGKYKRGWGLSIGPRKKHMLLAQLRRDVTFLEEQMVMDYSLLVGVKRGRKAEGGGEAVRGIEGSVDGEKGEELSEIKDLATRRKGRKRRKVWRGVKSIFKATVKTPAGEAE